MPDKSRADWLAGLKVGDPVIVTSGRSAGSLATVERITNTQVIVRGSRYRRKDGDRVGSYSPYSPSLEEPTSERLAEIAAERTLVNVRAIVWNDVPAATREAVLALVSKAGKAGR